MGITFRLDLPVHYLEEGAYAAGEVGAGDIEASDAGATVGVVEVGEAEAELTH